MRKSKPIPVERISRVFMYHPLSGHIERRDGYRGFVMKGTGYRAFLFEGKIYLAHRLAWALSTGDSVFGEVDHVNGDRDDNRLENLRLASSSEQNRNRRISRRNSSGVKGICWESSRKKWRAVIGDRPSFLVGRFDNLETAKTALVEARERLHGRFANHG